MTRYTFFKRYCEQAIAQSNFFGLSIEIHHYYMIGIQIQFSKWIDNPNPTKSTIIWKKIGQQILNGQFLR